MSSRRWKGRRQPRERRLTLGRGIGPGDLRDGAFGAAGDCQRDRDCGATAEKRCAAEIAPSVALSVAVRHLLVEVRSVP